MNVNELAADLACKWGEEVPGNRYLDSAEGTLICVTSDEVADLVMRAVELGRRVGR